MTEIAAATEQELAPPDAAPLTEFETQLIQALLAGRPELMRVLVWALKCELGKFGQSFQQLSSPRLGAPAQFPR